MLISVRFAILAVLTMKNASVFDVAPRAVVEVYGHLGGTDTLRNQHTPLRGRS
jgi:hypothetical protein